MKKILLLAFALLVLSQVVYAKTLVKYNKNSGDIIQTNIVNEMPSDEIINDRFRTSFTDVILVDEAVDISMQRVDLNKKKIKDIPQSELDSKKQADIQKKNKETQNKDSAKTKLKALGLTDDEVAVLFKGD